MEKLGSFLSQDEVERLVAAAVNRRFRTESERDAYSEAITQGLVRSMRSPQGMDKASLNKVLAAAAFAARTQNEIVINLTKAQANLIHRNIWEKDSGLGIVVENYLPPPLKGLQTRFRPHKTYSGKAAIVSSQISVPGGRCFQEDEIKRISFALEPLGFIMGDPKIENRQTARVMATVPVTPPENLQVDIVYPRYGSGSKLANIVSLKTAFPFPQQPQILEDNLRGYARFLGKFITQLYERKPERIVLEW